MSKEAKKCGREKMRESEEVRGGGGVREGGREGVRE